MTLTTPYSASFSVGDGETREFPFTFEEVNADFIKVLVYNVNGTVSVPTFTPDLDLKHVVFGDETPTPTADDVICIYRETPTIQDTPFRTLEGYNAKALENILSKIVAMIQEIKSTYFSTQVLQGDPWQLDLLTSADDGATVNIDYTAKKLVKGLYFKIVDGNLKVSADDSNYITMPKSADIVEFRQVQTVLEDLTVQYRLQYRIGNEWFNAESNAEATADEAKQIAEEARDIASDAKDIAQDASDKVDGFDGRLTQAEQDASDAKDIAQDASDAVSAHITDTNNPHSVTKAQVGLDNVDNTSDLDKPISTATQTALDLKMPISTKYGAALSLTINSTTYVVTAQLKDQDGNNIGTAQTIDLPLESVVVSGSYDSDTKEVILVLENGSEIRFSVADLISGLQSEITAQNPLDADLVNDSTSAHKFVTATEKTNWNNHIANTNNPHQVTKAQVGLSNVDNTSDLNKPISTATQTALDLKADKSTTYTKTETDALLSAKQDTISDLSEIRSGAALGTTAVQPGDLATVATSGSYNDLSDKPTIPAAQVNSDWNANSGVAQILNKPNLATVATSGNYNDLSNKPTIPTVNDATLTIQKNGTSVATFTANSSSNVTANISVPTDTNDLTNGAGYITGITSSDVTTALGYTPYSDANPNGYTSNVGTVTSVNSVSPDGSGNVSLTIPTVNDATITITQGGITKGSFTLNQATGDTIALDAGGGGGSADIDNLTITENADQEIQAVAVIDQNTGIAKTWTGTMAEYEAIVTKDPETEYIITDDIGGSATEIGQITEALNNKVDTGHQVVEFQAPTVANNYTWYRKYADGWVEQGGVITTATTHPTTTTLTQTLPIAMADTNYILILKSSERLATSSNNLSEQYANSDFGAVGTKTTTSFTFRAYKPSWQVSGMAA